MWGRPGTAASRLCLTALCSAGISITQSCITQRPHWPAARTFFLPPHPSVSVVLISPPASVWATCVLFLIGKNRRLHSICRPDKCRYCICLLFHARGWVSSLFSSALSLCCSRHFILKEDNKLWCRKGIWVYYIDLIVLRFIRDGFYVVPFLFFYVPFSSLSRLSSLNNAYFYDSF